MRSDFLNEDQALFKNMQTPDLISKTTVKTRLQPKLSPMQTHSNSAGQSSVNAS